jgi:hypothetical protein
VLPPGFHALPASVITATGTTLLTGILPLTRPVMKPPQQYVCLSYRFTQISIGEHLACGIKPNGVA